MKVATLLLFASHFAIAEPWLTNRYAENCAACHAPGRVNVEASARRCTLSCQGCHVNPNGGGLRNHYGKFLESRWLRSFQTTLASNTTAVPKPTELQLWAQKPLEKTKSTGKKKKQKRTPQAGFPMATLPDQTSVDESAYDRRSTFENQIGSTNDEILYQIPNSDPYRLRELSLVDGGADFRWLARKQIGSNSSGAFANQGGGPKWMSFLMAADFGLRLRPVVRYFNLVYETRMYGSPAPSHDRHSTISKSYTKTLYAMLDDLPYNSFVMAGLYVPSVGSPDSDHTSLAQKTLAKTLYAEQGGRAQNMMFEAIGVGTAPNVPFFQIHMIRNKLLVGNRIEGDQTRGFAINGGLRFVTLGFSVNASHWSLKDDNKLSQLSTDYQLSSLGLGARMQRIVFNIDALSMSKKDQITGERLGGVVTTDLKLRVWRAYYATVQYAYGNTDLDLQPGYSIQTRFGIRGFHLAGLESTVSYDISEQRLETYSKRNESGFLKTAHLTYNIHAYL